MNPYDAVEEGSGDGVNINEGVDVTTALKLMVGVEDGCDLKVGETGVMEDTHPLTITARRTSLDSNANFFKIFFPLLAPNGLRYRQLGRTHLRNGTKLLA